MFYTLLQKSIVLLFFSCFIPIVLPQSKKLTCLVNFVICVKLVNYEIWSWYNLKTIHTDIQYQNDSKQTKAGAIRFF